MIAQITLSILLSLLFLYAIREGHRSPIIRSLTMCTAALGGYLVWVPEHASSIAAWAGVGRGADLILYLWIPISLLMMLNLHLKHREHLELLTKLARHVALTQAQPEVVARFNPLGSQDGDNRFGNVKNMTGDTIADFQDGSAKRAPKAAS